MNSVANQRTTFVIERYTFILKLDRNTVPISACTRTGMMGYGSVFRSPGGCSNPAGRYDLGIIIDGSGSVGNVEFAQSKMFLLQLINRFPVGADSTRFGVILYSDIPKLITRFSDVLYYIPIQLKLRLLGLEFPDGETRTDKALKMAGTELYAAGQSRDQVPHVLVVFTDGDTKQGSESYDEVLKPLKVIIKQH